VDQLLLDLFSFIIIFLPCSVSEFHLIASFPLFFFFFLLCFSEIRPNARIMLHQPRGGASGVAADIDIQAREILRMREMLNNLYVYHTKQPLSEIERVMDRDTFMSPEEALKFGLIDKILSKRNATDI
jgi:hypothetical protein